MELQTLLHRKIYSFPVSRKAHKTTVFPKVLVVHKVLAAYKVAVEQRQQVAAAVERQRVGAAVGLEAAIL
jgi:hypothetical protein